MVTFGVDAYLRFMRRALVLARLSCQSKDVAKAEVIVDALHNLPGFLLGDEYPAFEQNFYQAYVVPVHGRYPELGDLADELPPR